LQKIKDEMKNLRKKSMGFRIIYLIVILLAGFCPTPLLSVLIQMLVNGVAFREAMSCLMNDVGGLRMMQGVQTLLVFVLPPFLLCRVFREPTTSYLSIKKVPWTDFLIAFVCVLASVPIINLLTAWNESIQLPACLSGLEKWMRASENRAAYATEMLMSGTGLMDYLACLLVVAIMAGFGEELLFRGVIQRMFSDAFDKRGERVEMEYPSSSYLYIPSQRSYTPSIKAMTAAIWLTAFIFSAIHFQFYGFIPRLLLGAWFGYLLWWTGSIWVPIFAHFMNNALSLSFGFAEKLGWIPQNLGDDIGTGSSWWICLISLLMIALSVVYYLQSYRLQSGHMTSDVRLS
jgi:CAAX amino terminal protease family.